jgi:hypothetical protein
MVWDKVLCMKIGVYQNCEWKMVYHKILCGKDGVFQNCVWKMVCDKVVCERCYVIELIWWVIYFLEVVCDRIMCERILGEKWCVVGLYLIKFGADKIKWRGRKGGDGIQNQKNTTYKNMEN